MVSKGLFSYARARKEPDATGMGLSKGDLFGVIIGILGIVNISMTKAGVIPVF